MIGSYNARHTRSQVMKRRRGPRLANLLGALSTGISDGIYESTAMAAGLDGVASAALIALLDFMPGGSVRTLSQVVGLTHSGAVRVVDRLVADGLVTRGTSVDARSRSITLTPRGVRVARQVRAARERVVNEVLEQFTASERATLAGLSERLVAGITEQRLERRNAGETPAGGALCRMCDFGACGREIGMCPAAETVAKFRAAQR
jgi:MarR family transcriptional regulator, negative regulator of the multidrug operon emrRAB